MSALDEIRNKSIENLTPIEWAINRIFLSGFEETAKNAADEFAGIHEQIEVCKGGKEVIDELRAALDEARKFIILLGNRDQAVQQVVQMWLAAHPKEK